MTPVHHVPPELLFSYAAGGLEAAEQLLVATHASLCMQCARTIERHERIAGALLEQHAPAAVSEGLLESTLARLDAIGPAQAAPAPQDAVLPAPIARITGPLGGIAWKQALPVANVFTLDLPLSLDGVPVRLRRFRPGTAIPLHSHRATEYDLVLTGGFTDHGDGRHFGRGDVSVNDERVTHRLTIDDGAWCVALSVHAARVKPVGLLARIVFGYTGW